MRRQERRGGRCSWPAPYLPFQGPALNYDQRPPSGGFDPLSVAPGPPEAGGKAADRAAASSPRQRRRPGRCPWRSAEAAGRPAPRRGQVCHQRAGALQARPIGHRTDPGNNQTMDWQCWGRWVCGVFDCQSLRQRPKVSGPPEKSARRSHIPGGSRFGAAGSVLARPGPGRAGPHSSRDPDPGSSSSADHGAAGLQLPLSGVCSEVGSAPGPGPSRRARQART